MSKPGKFKEPLRDNDRVVRVGLTTSQNNYKKVSPDQFIVTEREKAEDWKRISVFETSLSSDSDVVNLTTNPERIFIIKFSVGDLRDVIVNNKTPFDVKWDPLSDCLDQNLNILESAKSGCEGHCGLDGLHAETKIDRRDLRVELARFATNSGNFYLYQAENN